MHDLSTLRVLNAAAAGREAAHADNDGDGATATKIFSTSWSETFTRDSAAWRAYVEAYQLGRKEG